MHTKTLRDLLTGLVKHDFSSFEITQHFLSRIKQLNKKINGLITVTEDHALARAKEADEKRANGTAGTLAGIPFMHKDIFCTKGIKTSCGSKMLDNFIAPYDATVHKKFSNSGMVLLGKTNMDEFAMGASNENSYYSPTYNPWDLNTVPGGSSGGSAACVAARLTPTATGTDTGGSIRQPAAFCGVTGLKPTYGRVSRFGMIAFASSLDQGGPIAQTAEDCALILEAMAGFDANDSTSIDKPVSQYTASLNKSISGLKIGVPKEFLDKNLNPEIAKIIETAIKQYTAMGASIKTISLPNASLSIPAYYIIAPAECSSNLARFDGVRFGYRCENPTDLQDLYKRSRSEGFGSEVKRRIMIGTYVLSAGYYDAYYLQAQKVRKIITNDYQQAFKDVDIILGPTTPSTAFKIGEKANDPVSMYLSDMYTCGVNLAGLPALSMPGGFIKNMPVGVQLIGNYFDESKILNAAHQYQMNTDWHTQIPKDFK